MVSRLRAHYDAFYDLARVCYTLQRETQLICGTVNKRMYSVRPILLLER